MIVLMSISEKSQAGPWTNWAFGRSSCARYGGYGYNKYGYKPVLGRSPWTNWAFGRSSYGGYGYYGSDRTLRRVTGYGGLAMGVFQMLDQSSVTNRLVDHQISVDNRMVGMAERDQQIRAQNNTVLVRRGPIVLQVKKPKTQKNENQELQQEIESLKLELEKLKLQQELEKAKK